MTPIYDKNGQVVGWIKNDVIFDLRNRYVAFISNNNVFDYIPRHLGSFQNGYFKDKFGNAVALIEGAQGGPIARKKSIPPIPPIPPIPRIPPIPPIPPITPIGSLNWSNTTWNELLFGLNKTGEVCQFSGTYGFVTHADGTIGCHPTSEEMDIPLDVGDRFPPIKSCKKGAFWIFLRR